MKSISVYLEIEMGRGVDMRFSDSGAGGFGIKKRSWFGGGGRRPAFMEPLAGGVPPPIGEASHRSVATECLNFGRLAAGGRRSSFPVKDDAGYIGYLTDDDDMVSSDEGSVVNMVSRRRRQLLGSDADVSFSNCMMMIIMICGLLMLFLFAVSPWGVPPPRRL